MALEVVSQLKRFDVKESGNGVFCEGKVPRARYDYECLGYCCQPVFILLLNKCRFRFMILSVLVVSNAPDFPPFKVPETQTWFILCEWRTRKLFFYAKI